MSADDAAKFINSGTTVGMSGFTGSGYPKAVPVALAARIDAERDAGRPFRLRVWTGASTGPELDGALAKVDAIEFRLPYNSDPIVRDKINRGEMEYFDMHLSQVAPVAWQGFLGPLDTAVVEITAIRADGSLVPSTSVGNNKTWLDRATKVILEVNSWQNAALEGMHDIYYGTALPPHRSPIPLIRPDGRIGQPALRVDPDKIVAIVETHAPDRNLPFSQPDEVAYAIANHLIEFFVHEVKKGRLPHELLPLQSGVGNIPNAVLSGLLNAPFDNMTSYTEVVQDGMLDLLEAGKLRMASATAFSLSPDAAEKLDKNLDRFRDKIILRPQENLEPPGGDPPPRLPRHERADRGRHLRQRQLDARDGLAHPERHRRLGRLRPQRLCVDLHDAVDRQGRQNLGHRAAVQPRRPHQPGRPGDRHRVRPGRPARPVAQAARRGDHRQLRAPGLPPSPGRLFQACQGRQLRPARALAAQGVALLAPALHRDRLDEVIRFPAYQAGEPDSDRRKSRSRTKDFRRDRFRYPEGINRKPYDAKSGPQGRSLVFHDAVPGDHDVVPRCRHWPHQRGDGAVPDITSSMRRRVPGVVFSGRASSANQPQAAIS